MSGLSCEVDYDGDPNEFYSESLVRARKAHKCCECGRSIAPGETYERVSGKWGGAIDTYKTCPHCLEVRGMYDDVCKRNSWIFTQLEERLSDDVCYNDAHKSSTVMRVYIMMRNAWQVGGRTVALERVKTLRARAKAEDGCQECG